MSTSDEHGHEHGHEHEEATYPPGIAASAHALGPYLYRVDELVLTARDPAGLPEELRRLQELLARPGLRRRVQWDLLVYRLLLQEYPPHGEEADEADEAAPDRSASALSASALSAARSASERLPALLRRLQSLLRGKAQLRLEVKPVGDPIGASQLLVLGQARENPDLAPVLVQRLRTLTLERGEWRPSVTPNHVLWAASHPMGYSAEPPVPDPGPLPPLPPPAPAERSVVAAVVDNGVDTSLPWFAGTVDPLTPADVPGPTVDDHGLLRTFAGHGTFVAGTLLDEARRGRDAEGHQVRVVSVVDSDADGYLSDASAAQAVDRVRDRIAQGGLGAPSVVLLAWGGYTHDGAGLPLVSAAVDALVALPSAPAVVAAAGNDSVPDRLVYPASLRGVVGVAATTGDTPAVPADFTNSGWWVDASATGRRLLGPFPVVDGVRTTGVHGGDVSAEVLDFDSGWALWSGTSVSAARVAGVIAREIADSGGALSGAEAWRQVRARSAHLTPTLGVLVLTGDPQA
jgi:hypothetical protein